MAEGGAAQGATPRSLRARLLGNVQDLTEWPLIFLAAAVGIIAGRTVTRHGREFPVAIAVEDGGLSARYSKTW